jgi:acetyl esterase/lipase
MCVGKRIDVKGYRLTLHVLDRLFFIVMRDYFMSIIKKREPFAIWPGPIAPISETPLVERQTPLLWGTKIIRNVTVPTLIPFYPAKPNGTAVIICPGGAFQFLMIDKEGTEVAHWLNAYGVTAFILKYRLSPTPSDDAEFQAIAESSHFEFDKIESYIKQAIADGQQALSLIRQQARELGINQDKIGMMGFSAGGSIAVYSALNQDVNNHPNFLAAIYGAPPGLNRIPANAPPLFIAQANDDPIIGNVCLELFSAWRTAKAPVEFHAYTQGGHGFGVDKQDLPCDNWTADFIAWLKSEGYLPKN